MKKIIFFQILISFLYSCNTHDKNVSSEQKSLSLKQELINEEYNTPLNYISAEEVQILANKVIVQEKDFLKKEKYGYDGYVLNGVIKSKATLAKFKDIKIGVMFYSKTNSLIKQKEIILYEIILPGKSQFFTLKISPPENYSTFKINILSALPAY